MAGNWRKYIFFDKDVVSENVVPILGSSVTCGCAEGGMLVFGDVEGNIKITDRNLNVFDRKEKAFRGAVSGVAYLFDPRNHRQQYVIAIGDDSPPISEDKPESNNGIFYFIKVFVVGENSRPIQSFLANSFLFQGLMSSQPLAGSSSAMTSAPNAAPTNTNIIDPKATLTAFSVLPDGSQIAVGFSNGAVCVFNGSFLKDSGVNRNPPFQVLLGEHSHAVSQLFFSESLKSNQSKSSSNDRQIRLFAVFDHVPGVDDMNNLPSSSDLGSILVFDVSLSTTTSGAVIPSSTRRPVHVLDEFGASKLCASYIKDLRELVVGRSEGVFSYSVEDRGAAAGFEGIKQCVTSVGRYILVANQDDKTKRTNINIYDLRNKFISFSGQIAASEKINLVLHDGGIAYILTSSNMMIRYREKDTTNKIEVLLRKSLFPLAIALATEEQSELSEIMKLYKLYGDHLYKKGEYDSAIQQYVTAIGYLQSSYVIRRYLDPHRIHNLIFYLEKLQERNQASKDHVKLLLTCYARIRDESKIQSFLKWTSQPTSKDNSSTLTKFPTVSSVPLILAGVDNESTSNRNLVDVPACFDILNGSGFVEHALSLALYFGYHELYLRTQINRGGNGVAACLTYLSAMVFTCPIDMVVYLLKSLLPSLLRSHTEATTALLVLLCSGDYLTLQSMLLSASSSSMESEASDRANSSNKATLCRQQFQSCLNSTSESVLVGPLAISASSSSKAVASNSNVVTVIPNAPVVWDDLFSFFIDYSDQLQVLIEGVMAGKLTHQMVLPEKVAHLLLELYLEEYHSLKSELKRLASTSSGSGVSSSIKTMASKTTNKTAGELTSLLKIQEDKIMNILDGHSSEYHFDRALLLTQSFHFDAGTRFLLERSSSTDWLLQSCMESQDERAIFKVLKREGSKEPEICIRILKYFVQKASMNNGDSDDEVDENSLREGKNEDKDDDDDDDEGDDDDDDRWDAVTEVIDFIDREGILSPTQVIEILSDSKVLPLHVASRYLTNWIQSTNVKIADYESTTAKTQEDIRIFLQEKEALAQLGPKKLRPIGDLSDDEEDEVSDEFSLKRQERIANQKKWQDIKMAQTNRRQDDETFYSHVFHNTDGFKVIAEYFGKKEIF